MIKPIAGTGNKVFLKVETETKTASGIILDTADSVSRTQRATVVAISDKDAMGLPPKLEEGNVVLVAKNIGYEIEFEGEKLVVIRESDVIGVI